jgi:pyruvate dehydrogenase E2 component (dihydrolipoamide acetyltransferase)
VSESCVPHCGDNDGCPESLGNGRRRFFIHAARFREGNQSGTQSVCTGRAVRGRSLALGKPNEKAPFRDDPSSPSSVARATHGRDARVPAPRAVRARCVAVGRRVRSRRRAESDRVSDASPSRGALIAPSENISTSRTRSRRLFSCALSSAPTLGFRASNTKRSSLTAHTLLNADANANANADANARLLFSRTYVEQPITTTALSQVTAANGQTTSRETSAPPDLARVWPSVRRLLAESKLDGSNIAPTGPKRTLTKGDVLAAMGLCAPPKAQRSLFFNAPTETMAASESSSAVSSNNSSQTLDTHNATVSEEEVTFSDLPVTPTRRVIASRLLASKAEAPHFYVSSDVSLRGVEKLRLDLKRISGAKASVNDCVMYAVSRALSLVPEINGADNAVDVAVAVATPNGLITPIVRDADSKSLSTIGAEVRELAKRAREGKLKPHEFTGGSFSVSNLGMFPVDSFSAILNPPQGAIMAVGRGRDALAIDPADATNLVSSPVLSATVSADARAASEADVARFLEAFKDVLENPEGGEGREKWAL